MTKEVENQIDGGIAETVVAPCLSHCYAALFHIEYEVFPTRAIYFVSIAADDEAAARQAFSQQCGRGRIRKIERKEGKWQAIPKN